MISSTGRLPPNFAGGLYKNPEIIFPSKLFQWMSSAAGNDSVFTALSLLVQRSSFSLATSMKSLSAGPTALKLFIGNVNRVAVSRAAGIVQRETEVVRLLLD